MTSKSAAILAFLLVILTAGLARPEHEVYYRYTVLGYVKDGAGQLRQGVQVELVREKTGFSYLGQTDPSGLFVIVARLGDEAVGEQLRLRAGEHATTLIARFDPKDHARERGTRVDLVGARWLETPTTFAATLKRFIAQ